MTSSELMLFLLFVNSATAFLFAPLQEHPLGHIGCITHRRLPADQAAVVPAGPRAHAVDSFSFLKSSSPDDNEMSADEAEEVLLRMNLSIKAGIDPDAAIEALRGFAKGFPFAAVLPVQPLTYLPSATGVKVTFLRKKTEEKGSQDGGMDFSIEFTDVASPDDDDEIGIGTLAGRRIRLRATRISEGQTVSKMFSEKMVVTEFVKRINLATESPSALGNVVSMDSYFHKWMD